MIRWWATRYRFTPAIWRFRPSTPQAHTTRPSPRHSRTARTKSTRRSMRRSSHCPHSSIVGSFNLSNWGRQPARAQDISSYDEDAEEYNSLGCLRPPRSLWAAVRRRFGTEGEFSWPAAVNTPAVQSKRAGSTGTPKTAKQRRVRESSSAATLAGEPITQWDVSEDHLPPAAVPRPALKSVTGLDHRTCDAEE
jgi:hypothetical protein